MQTKFDPDDLDGALELHDHYGEDEDEDGDKKDDEDDATEEALGHLALAALKMARSPSADQAAIRAMIRKVGRAEAAMTAKTIAIAESNTRLMRTNQEIEANRRRFDDARALERGFNDLAKNLRAMLPV